MASILPKYICQTKYSVIVYYKIKIIFSVKREIMINNLLTSTVRAVRENIQPRSCCIDRAIARSIQQDRGWIFSRTARTVEVSKFFIICRHCTFVKKWEKVTRGHSTKSETFAKKRQL